MSILNRAVQSDEISTMKHKLHVYLIFIYILIVPLNMVEIPLIGSAMKMSSIAILTTSLALLYSDNIAIKYNNRLFVAWAAYVAYTFISIFWSSNFESSLSTAIGLLQVLIISFVLTQIELHDDDIRTIEFAWILVSLICLLLFFGGAGQQYDYGGRTTILLRSGTADPNEFCAYFFMTLAILMVRLFNRPSKIKMICYITIILAIFYCILMTGSRGGLLSGVAVVATSWIVSTSISLKKVILLVLLTAVLILAFQYLFLPNLPQPVLERFQLKSMLEDRGSGRTDIWMMALNDIFSGTMRVFLGYGPFGITFMRDTMHNHFLQALMDGGILGLILFVNFLIELVRKAFQNGPIFIGGMAGAFTAMLTLTAYSYFKLIWLIFMMCLLTISTKKNVVEKS
ncbi:O-antigen ligase family protein [Acidaminobacter hydrogenoformans]|uniref:O-antigen ligase n=1 Tax=Acidaminobacter hydrogenoformans DSM 2784 TaxID=1120920 RepID=A0A1G5RQE3_9FIRM|nr:O-antigen ligase family protein [Acidaminobacter hydrogenoformans]SCZ76080.1 O-antigen ligase [Acidaminobacter hydrogenoformans DSM 2784]